MADPKTILAFGELLWDLLPGGAMLGGAPFNFSYRVHELGFRGLMISRLGRDERGDEAMARIKSLGMDGSLVQWDDARPTGTVNIIFDALHNPDYTIVPDVAYDHIETNERILEAAAKADCLCFGTLAQRCEVSRGALGRLMEACSSAVKVLDLNLRKDCFSEETVLSSLESANIVKLNEDEALWLARVFDLPAMPLVDFCRRALDKWKLTHCLVTLGERGAFCASRTQCLYVPGYKTRLADSCGSGDAFTAGFVSGLLDGKSLGDCCEKGNLLGAIVASRVGATSPIDPELVENFLASGPVRTLDAGLTEYIASP
jgi:fructokinase